MRQVFSEQRRSNTEFVNLNTAKCTACWECINSCRNKVIRKINLPWHKHAIIAKPEMCTGCLRCIRECKSAAFTKIVNTTNAI